MRLRGIFLRGVIFVFAAFIFSSCGRYNDISIKEVSNVKFLGLKQNVVILSFDIEIDNPNTRKISVFDIEFKAWLNNRELGIFRVTQPIKLTPCSKNYYSVPAEIELRTIADAIRIATSGSIETLLDRIEVEGVIKAKSFPARKKIKVDRQTFKSLSSSL